MPALRAPQDAAAGALFVAFGAGALFIARNWDAGTVGVMGSGFVPQLVAGLLFMLGVAIFVGAFFQPGPGIALATVRPLAIVTAGVAAFAASLETLGLIVAILAVIALSALAGGKARFPTFAALGVFLCVLCWALFIWGLQLPIRLWPF